MDPRDKVFALHSLSSTAGLTLPAPDYTKDTETVYRETTKAIILYEKKLSVFEYINGLDSLSNTSSWSPDFSERRMPLRPSRRNFRASGQSSLVYSFSKNETLLLCRGRVLEKLSACGVALLHCGENLGLAEKYLTWSRNLQPREEIWICLLKSAPEFNSAILHAWQVYALRNFLSFVFSTRPSGQTRSDAFRELQSCFMSYMKNRSQSFYHIGKVGDWDVWSKNIMGEFFDEAQTLNPVPHSSSEAIDQQHDEGILWARNEQLREFRYIRDCLKDSKASLALQTSEFRILQRICRSQSQAVLHHAITGSAVYQTLFRASSTSNLGMAPHSIRDGDQIALIAGLRVPMIVRPRENGHYRMIAPVHICGIMERQAWDTT